MADMTAQFRTLEESLWRNAPPGRDEILADDFTEFCRFGAVYDRDHLIEPTETTATVDFPFDSFRVEELTADVVLVTYENTVRTSGEAQRARRSSVWVKGNDGWKLRFMQATTLED